MIKLLARLFIKDYKNYALPEVRYKYGVLCGAAGIFLNIVLFAAKFAAGVLAASVAFTTDAFNNLSDAGSSIVAILGFSLSNKKPDVQHPFGHGRLEYISGLIVSFLIISMGWGLFTSSIDTIRNPQELKGGLLPMLIMVLAIGVKFYMYLYNHGTAKKISSAAMEATAKDSFSDMFSTSVTLLAVLLAPHTSLPVDGIAGLLVAAFIMYTGIDAARETIAPLLGEPPSSELVKQIEGIVMGFPEICGIHDLLVHDYGPGRLIISLHAEVPGDKDIFALHDAVDRAEHMLATKFNCVATIHLDPIDTHNERLYKLKALAAGEAAKIDGRISIHDVRIVPGVTHTNLIFDAVRPYECALSAEELRATLAERIHAAESDVFCVITVDNPYV